MTKLLKTTLALLVAGGGLIASGSAVAGFPSCPTENFDGVVAPAFPIGWTASNATAGGAGTFTTVSTVSDTAPNSAFATDLPTVNDVRLDSPTFAPTPGTALTFRNRYNLENTFDGAVLEISVNGGAFQDIVTAGGVFVAGGYNGTISANVSFGGPIPGRRAWTGSTAGAFTTTTVAFPPSAINQPSQLRFRTGDDNSTAATAPAGWWVDSITCGAAPPSVAKSFAPTNAPVGGISTLTIALAHPAGVATLTSDLVDTFPAGLVVAPTPNAVTTCTTGVAVATAGGGTLTLQTGAQIPVAGCTVSVDVTAAAPGIFVNTIPVGALMTDAGNNAAATSATFQATQAGSTTYSTGFETPTFVVGPLGTQGGWGKTAAATAADFTIATINPGAGTQHLRILSSGASTSADTAIAPTQAVGTTTYTIASAKLAINQGAATSGTEMDFSPQDPAAGSITTRVRFLRPTAGVNKIQVLDPNGGGPGVSGFVDTGAFWTAGAYFDLKIIANRAAKSSEICINGASIFTVAGFAKNIGNLAITNNRATAATVGNILDVDDVVIDNTNIGTCNGLLPPHTVTPSVGTPSGTITPATAQVVADGGTTAFTLAADPGFHIDTTTGTCPGSLAGNVYTAGPITADCTVIANFAADVVTHVVTPSVGTGTGTITPSTPQVVNDGASQAFTLAPAVGFHIDPTTGTCPGSLAGSVYTAGPITADCTVIANFAADVAPGTFPPDENFDEVTAPALPAGWVSAQTGAGTAWTTDSTVSDTAPNSAHAAEFPSVADMTLTSPTFTAVAGQTVSFKHRYNLEHGSATTAYDGAVLEISINGGAFTDIVTAGGMFTTGGYNSTVSASFSSPLASRACWSGNSATFVAAVATLPAAAVGQPTQLRFRTADDSSVVATAPNGWWVDTIHLDVAAIGPPSATVTPASLSFTVQADQTQDQTLNIANAINSSPLTFSIAGLASRHINFAPHGRSANREYASRDFGKVPTPRAPLSIRSNQFASGQHSRPAPWSPIGPNSTILFQADDGTYENSIALSAGTTQNSAIWINRYPVTEAMTIDSISIDWPNAATANGDVTGKSINLVVYYDADADGDPTNAVRLGTDTLITIAGPDTFENYTTNFSVPGAGDVYIGFVDAFATGGSTPVLYSAALDSEGDPTIGWVSGSTTGDADVANLANNDLTGTISGLTGGSLPGVWMVRATGTAGGGAPCTGAPVNWLTATPASGTVNGGSNTNVTITANPSADSLAPGSYTGELCITTNDPAQLLIARPVSLTVTPVPFVPCSGGADEIFCDGFDGGGGGGNVVTGTINQPAIGDPNGSSFDFALGSFHPYDGAITADDINLYSNTAPAINVYWYADAVPAAFSTLVGGVVGTPGGTNFVVLHSGDVIGPSSPVSAASTGADMSAFEAGVDGYIGVAFYNEGTSALDFGYLHVTTSAGGFPIQVLDYGYDNSGAAITIP